MSKKLRYFIVVALFSVVGQLFLSCSSVPISGRKQLNLIPESEMIAMGATSYGEFLKENKLSQDKDQTALVKKVGGKIAAAVGTYLNQHGLGNRIAGYAWDFNLVEDATPNAWCMPGGKVVFYTGILPITKNESGIAVVMGHEIAHAIARHGNERMTQGLLIQTGGTALAVALQEKPEQTQQLFAMAYGIGTTVGISLPYSRAHESEADHLGLIFMAMAGYNPSEAVEFWKRMEALGGQKPPEFLSTHPADATRIENIKKLLPEAMTYYKK